MKGKSTYIIMIAVYALLLLLLYSLLPSLGPQEALMGRGGLWGWAFYLALCLLVLLPILHRRMMRPMRALTDGMSLLREQDFSSRLSPVGQPEADRVVEVFNSMMGRLREERLHVREQERLLDLLVSVSPMGVVMLDLDGRVQSMNPAAVRLLAVSGKTEGKIPAELDSPLATRLAELKEGESLTTGTNDAHIYRLTRSSFPDRGFSHPFLLVESLTEEVMNAQREAYERVIRMIAHEVNNSMATARSILDMTQQELSSEPQHQEAAGALEACAERCDALSAFITRFASVVKVPEANLMPVGLNDLVESNRLFLESLCSRSQAKLHFSLCNENPRVMCDAELMMQALVNILKNAVESPGPPPRQVWIETQASPACIIIADNGSGITEKVERSLFTPFFTTKPRGSGLGLLLVREVLRRHQCRFSLRTDADGLTRFRIWLREAGKGMRSSGTL